MINSAAFIVEEADISALRNVVTHIANIGYNESKICERLDLTDLTNLLWRALPIYREEKLSSREIIDIAIDLFLLQGSISKEELNKLFDKAEQELLVRVGLLIIDGICIARASLYPLGDRLIFSDHAWPMLLNSGYTKVPYDQVMSIGTDSRWLARATVRKQVRSTLDLCTGSGIHALLASYHSDRVVAIDISARAAKCARFNTHSLGLTNIEIKLGDLYEPVQGDLFDLITANPPFVPSPVDNLGFRDGGPSGDDVHSRIIAGLPKYLASGGIAQIVTEFGESDDNLLSERLRLWLNGAPMDILILRLRENTAANYAIGHASGDESYEDFFNSVHDWSNNLKNQGYTRVVSVLLAFQWSDLSSGQPWTRIEESQPPHRDAGNELESMFLAERFARLPNISILLEQSEIRRAYPLGLIESQVLGNSLYKNTEVKLMGKSFSMHKWLNPIEREILVFMDKPMKYQDILVFAKKLNITSEDTKDTICSLIREGLILLG